MKFTRASRNIANIALINAAAEVKLSLPRLLQLIQSPDLAGGKSGLRSNYHNHNGHHRPCSISIIHGLCFPTNIQLVSARRRANSKSTMSLLNNLIISTIETGAITAVLALIQLVLYKVYPSNYMHVTVEFVLGRLYVPPTTGLRNS